MERDVKTLDLSPTPCRVNRFLPGAHVCPYGGNLKSPRRCAILRSGTATYAQSCPPQRWRTRQVRWRCGGGLFRDRRKAVKPVKVVTDVGVRSDFGRPPWIASKVPNLDGNRNDAQDVCGMLCHQIWHFLQQLPSNSASSAPSRIIRGNGSPDFLATRFVPADLAQIWNSSSEATW